MFLNKGLSKYLIKQPLFTYTTPVPFFIFTKLLDVFLLPLPETICLISSSAFFFSSLISGSYFFSNEDISS